MRVMRCLSVMILVLLIVSTGYCEILAYESFRYEPGELEGVSADRLGFAGQWQEAGGNPVQCTVEPNSLEYPGAEAMLQDNSGSFQVVIPEWGGARLGRFLDTSSDGPFSEYLNQQGTIGTAGKTIYISFLMETSHADSFYAFELKRENLGDEGAVLYIGDDVGGQTQVQVCAFKNTDTSEQNIGHQFNWLGEGTTDTELYVIRIDFGSDSDDVTVYRNPSMDEEPVKSPDLAGAGWLDFDGISMACWVDPAGRTARFDEICIASTYEDALRFYVRSDQAQNPDPADGDVDVDVTSGVALAWQAGQGVSPSSYDVYFSDDLNEIIREDANAFVGNTADTTIDVSGVNTDSTYYWCVNQNTSSGTIPGPIWVFDSVKTRPQITDEPGRQLVDTGDSAVFTVSADSNSPVSYQWFDSSGALSDGGNISGSNTDTLVIDDVSMDDEGQYYCQVSNSAGTVTSEQASLMVKRLVGYWKLDQNSDTGAAFQDYSDSGNNLELDPNFAQPSTFTWTQGPDGTEDSALVFDGTFALAPESTDGTMADMPVDDNPYTISIWFKTEKTDSGFIGWGGYGNVNQTNVLCLLPGDGHWIRNYWWEVDVDGSRGYSLSDNAWHHAAATYDGDVRTVYIDGIEAGSDNPVAHKATNENFRIGKANPLEADGQWVVGALDEAKVYNYALSNVEVAHLYTDITGGDICVFPPMYDLDGDCRVDLTDFALLSQEWMDCGLIPACE